MEVTEIYRLSGAVLGATIAIIVATLLRQKDADY